MTWPETCKRVILTGDLQVGKSTLVRRILEHRSMSGVGGFYTRRLGPVDAPTGFSLCSWTGEEQQFCWREPETDRRGVNRRLDLAVFSGFGVQLLAEAVPKGVLVIDELGYMERGETCFESALVKAIQDVPVAWLVIQKRALDHWSSVLPLTEYAHYEVTDENRDALFERFCL